MDTLFACEYVVDRKKYLSWGRESIRSPLLMGFMIFWCIMAAVIFAAAIYFGYYPLLLFCLFALYRGLFRRQILVSRQYSILARQYGSENWTRKISFTEDIITTSEGNVSIQTPFSEVAEIEEKSGCISLHLKNKTRIRLYSDCFVTGTWEECRAHLLRRMNSD